MVKKSPENTTPAIVDNVEALEAKLAQMREAQALFATYTPVSYTHLDVYMRQDQGIGTQQLTHVVSLHRRAHDTVDAVGLSELCQAGGLLGHGRLDACLLYTSRCV